MSARRRAEEALRRSEERYRTLFETMAQGVVYQDATGRVVSGNPAAEAILGVSAAEMCNRTSLDPAWQALKEDGSPFPGDEHPAMVALRSGAAIRNVVMGVLNPKEGAYRWLLVSAAPQSRDGDRPSGVYTTFEDISERRRMEEALRESHQLLARLRESNIVGVILADPVTIYEANDAFLQMVGYTREELELGMIRWWDMTPPEFRGADQRGLQELVSTGACRAYEKAYVHKDGHQVPILIGAALVNRFPLRWVCFVVDLSSRKRAEAEREELLRREQLARAEAERASARLRLVSQASELLAESLDYPATFERLADLVVEDLADLCLIDVADQRGSIKRVVARHHDPARQLSVDRLKHEYPPLADGQHPASRVMRFGRLEYAADVTEELLQAATRDEVHAELVRQLGVRSFMCLPLVARGRSLGTLTLVSTDPRRRYGEDDLALAEEIARRAAVRIDNARLYDERDRTARILQRSLLPARLPTVPGVDLAAHHLAAGEGNEVGGDFYDVFAIGESTWAVAIGDVCGKGPAAAAVMGMARHTLRALARFETHPSRLLQELNRALVEQSTDERFCTVCYLRLQLVPDGAGAMVCSGGHPLPLVLRRDGRVDAVGVTGHILGAFPEVELVDRHLQLHPGDTLVLYTDGVVEQRGVDVTVGEARLRRLLLSSAGADARSLITRIEDDVLGRTPGLVPNDDMALVVIRVPASDDGGASS